MGDVVVPDDPEDAVTPISDRHDHPDRPAALMGWLRDAGFEPEVTWSRRDLAVFAADLARLSSNPVRIFSGIQPTGAKHFGNYSGGFRQYAATQELGDAFFCVVDLHSITVDYDPADLRERTLDLAALLFATGLDPERSTVFAQSHVTAHAEAAWLLSAVASYGQLGRMTQFKEKGERQEFVSAGLFTYPVLMAGDILLYQTDRVPIGDDQRQHLELARDIAERFNARFGETFTVPQGVYPEVGARIMDLQEPTKKMSTTGGTPQGTLLLLDPPETIRKKVKSAVTDSGSEVRRGDDKPGITNLIDLMTVATGEPAGAIEVALRARAATGSSRATSPRRSSAMLEPIQARYARAPRRPGRAGAAARGRRRQGARGLGADARADVRGDGLRPPARRVAAPHRHPTFTGRQPWFCDARREDTRAVVHVSPTFGRDTMPRRTLVIAGARSRCSLRYSSALSSRPRAIAAKPPKPPAASLQPRQGRKDPARHLPAVRQRALLPGQPERPVRSRADAEPDQLPASRTARCSRTTTRPDLAHGRRDPEPR